jgi:hypothetical protein
MGGGGDQRVGLTCISSATDSLEVLYKQGLYIVILDENYY